MSSAVTTELRVTGMTCNNCARKVTDAAQQIPGVHSVSVNLADSRAHIRWQSDAEKNVSAALSAISGAGFEAQEIRAPSAVAFSVAGMTCNNCVRHVTDAIQGVPGVRSASVSLEGKSAAVAWTSAESKNVPAILSAISQAGYSAKEISIDAAAGSRRSHWQWNLIVGLGVTGVLMIGEWVFGLAMTPWFQWLAFALAGVVQIFCGAQFYRGAWRQIKVGQSNMDTLVALGSTTAFGYSAWALFCRRRRTRLFHGSRRHHFAHQLRPLARSPRQRQGQRRVEIVAESRAADCAKSPKSKVPSPKSRRFSR